jgi:hypothetical protein
MFYMSETQIQDNESDNMDNGQNPETETYSDEEMQMIQAELRKFDSEPGDTVQNSEDKGKSDIIAPKPSNKRSKIIMVPEPEPNDEVEYKRLEDDKFQLVPNLLINKVRDNILHPMDLIVWMVYSNHQRKKHDSWPGNRTVATLIGVCPTTVIRSNRMLIKAKEMVRTGKTKYGTKRTTLLTRVVGNKIVRLDELNGYSQAEPVLHAENPAVQNQIDDPIVENDKARQERLDSMLRSVDEAATKRCEKMWGRLDSGENNENDEVRHDKDDISF